MDGWTIETASKFVGTASIPAGPLWEFGEFYLIGESDVPADFADLTLVVISVWVMLRRV